MVIPLLLLAVFLCQQDNQKLYLVISEQAFLLFKPETENKCKLILWITLFSLAKLEHDTENQLIFYWHQKGKSVVVLILVGFVKARIKSRKGNTMYEVFDETSN